MPRVLTCLCPKLQFLFLSIVLVSSSIMCRKGNPHVKSICRWTEDVGENLPLCSGVDLSFSFRMRSLLPCSNVYSWLSTSYSLCFVGSNWTSFPSLCCAIVSSQVHLYFRTAFLFTQSTSQPLWASFNLKHCSVSGIEEKFGTFINRRGNER